MNSKFLFLFFVVISIFFVSCNSNIQDCSSQDTKYIKYSWDKELEKCIIDKEIDENVCGNGIIEKGETYCSCPKDVPNSKLSIEKGGCSGNKGEYLEYHCNDDTKQCELKITAKVKKKSKLVSLKLGSDLEIESEISYFVPFMKDRHKVNINLMLKNKANLDEHKVTDIKINKIYLITSGGDLLASKDVNKPLNNLFDTISESLLLDSFTMDTFALDKRNVNIKLLVSYKNNKYSKIKGNYELIKSINENKELKNIFESKFKIIDPRNKNEKIKDNSGWV